MSSFHQTLDNADGRRERCLTLVLCLCLVAAFVGGLYLYTHNFRVWTFEGQREVALEAGTLTAAQVPLHDGRNAPVVLWSAASTAPTAYLVDFIYTRCPSICRALGDEYLQMQQRLAAQRLRSPNLKRVHLVSISFDAEHDETASLSAYAREHKSDPALWTVAMPDTEADTNALMRSLDVIAIPDGAGGFVHNGAIHVLDASGQLRGLYEFDQWQQALLAAELLAKAGHTGL